MSLQLDSFRQQLRQGLPTAIPAPPPELEGVDAELFDEQSAGARAQGIWVHLGGEHVIRSQRPCRAGEDSEDEVELDGHRAGLSDGTDEATEMSRAGTACGSGTEQAAAHEIVLQRGETVDSEDEVVLERPVPSCSGGRGPCPDGWR